MSTMSGNDHGLRVEGVAFWASGLPGLQALHAFIHGGDLPAQAPARPSPQLLAPNERRRAPDSVALALEVALSACEAAGRDPAMLASVFASTHGDLGITDYICDALATAPLSLSPTRFHNSVHNAAAGYWTIGTGCQRAASAVSAHRGSFAQALLDVAATVHCEGEPVLLVGYDAASAGPLALVSDSTGLLGAALVLAPASLSTQRPGAPLLRLKLEQGDAQAPDSALQRLLGGNAMAPLLPLLELLVRGGAGSVLLHAAPGQRLRVEVPA